MSTQLYDRWLALMELVTKIEITTGEKPYQFKSDFLKELNNEAALIRRQLNHDRWANRASLQGQIRRSRP